MRDGEGEFSSLLWAGQTRYAVPLACHLQSMDKSSIQALPRGSTHHQHETTLLFQTAMTFAIMDQSTPNKHYSPHKRTRIVTAYDLGVPPRVIAAQEGVPAGSVRGIASRYRLQKSAQSSPRSGRPPLLSEQEKRRVMRCIADYPFITTPELVQNAMLTCSTRTLSRWLKKEGLAQQTNLRQPKLTEENAAKRLKLAQDYISQPSKV